MIASNSVDGLAAHDGFKAPERQIAPLARAHQLLRLPGFVAHDLGSIFTIRPIRCERWLDAVSGLPVVE